MVFQQQIPCKIEGKVSIKGGGIELRGVEMLWHYKHKD